MIDELTITRETVNDYFGMTITFEKDGEICVTMYDYVSKLIDQLPKNMKGNKKTLAGDWLFKTDEIVLPLIRTKKDKLYEITAKTLWLSQ